VNGTLALSEEDAQTQLYSVNNFFSLNSMQILDQVQSKLATNTNLNARATYTEPIGEKWTTQFNYYYALTRNKSERITNAFDENTQAYTRYVDTLSNDFDYKVNTNGGGVALAMKTEKYNFRIGTNVDYANISRTNRIDSSSILDNTLRWLPSAQFNYKFNRTSNFRISYNGNTKQPSIDQVQPVRDNSDPLNQVKGNPDLIQSYSQNINLSYNMWKAITDMSLWSYAGFNNTFNQIVLNKIVDESRRTISTYTNVNGGYSGWMGLNYGMRVNKLISMSLGANYNLSRNISFVNGIRTAVVNNAIRPRIGINLEQEEKFDFNLDYTPSFNNSSGGLVSGAGKYFSQNIRAYLRYKFTKNIEFNSEYELTLQAAQNAFADKFSLMIWNANVQWTMDKSKNFVLEVAVNDILNQNKGYQRSVNSDNTMERRYDTIRRYGFVSLIYNIKSKV